MLKALALLLLAATLAPAQIDDTTRKLSRDIFKQLIEINTTDSVGDNTKAAQAMAKRFLDAGFPAADVQVLIPPGRANKGNLVVRLRGPAAETRKPILLIGHLDVVEAKREDWTTDPFQFVEKDGYFYGRGTQDIKECDAMLVTAFLLFKQQGYQPARDLILALTSDEEGGSANGVDWLLKNHRKLIDAAFVLNVDSGGVDTDKGKPRSVEVGATEKVYADFDFTVTNPGGHSSMPVPDNAIYHLADALGRLSRSPFPFELNEVTRAYFKDIGTADMKTILANPADSAAVGRLSADPRYNSLTHTTCVATRLNAGHANNALPQTAQAIVNCRILPGHAPEEVRKELVAKIQDPKVVIHYVDNFGTYDQAPAQTGVPPAMPSEDVLKPLRRIADSLWPGAPVVIDMETGASDGKYTNAAGMSTYGIGEVAVDHDDVRAHGKDERLHVSSFYEGVDFVYRYLKAISEPLVRN